MQTAELISILTQKTSLSRRDVTRLLKEYGLLVTNQLQFDEPVTLPYCGRLVPIEQSSNGRPRRRSVHFEPGATLRKRLSNPLRRLRPV